MERNDKGVSSVCCITGHTLAGRLVWKGGYVGFCSRHLPGCLVDEVRRLEVKQPGAHMAPDIGLVAVEAQPLTAVLQLFRRREATELTHGRSALAGQVPCGGGTMGMAAARRSKARAKYMAVWMS